MYIHDAGTELGAQDKATGALVRVFCCGSKNLAWCAKVGWERVVLLSSLYGCGVIPTTTRWAQDLDREQVRMGRLVTGASQTYLCSSFNTGRDWMVTC